ncbi:hypothetical protein ASPWEDRAFT_44124 [Aspergillus wentii DTO 134E9]|uniref:Uncharacterized protein n=1 Tax=Aspergillus wentii DTO 134E9 TaxID=1073089 RepID=A0A1L9RAY8_ASPWE|nr:uncharacterized protein ASPWEDRAFT_44124 [Aspergillus wentii DTO 134E9]KAI9934665.1 hypothetical protein MW887_000282 [Aspergillus wentii]OJJ32092.1 hypothetical protein ASPWEDRAFT_44124 [Aspergillus wentii DTO 134E9]
MPPFLSPSPTILIPNLPPKTLVGIDLITFTSTANFHGIRDLPNGWHFLYSGTTETLSLRCGGWFYVGDINTLQASHDGAIVPTRRADLGPEVVIWKWNADTESLIPLKGDNDADKQEAMRHKANPGAVWQSGGLFRYRSRVPSPLVGKQIPMQDEIDEELEEEGKSNWDGLTNRLSPALLSRIIGDPEWDVDGRPRWMVTSAGTANKDSEEIPGIANSAEAFNDSGGAIEEQDEFTFLPIDLKRTWREGAIGRERTEAAQDRSWALGDLILRYSSTIEDTKDNISGEAQILGELQFCFLMTLTLMNYSCLQQWKRLLGLILTCRSAIKDRELFFRDFLALLLLQLKRCDDVDGGLFEIDGDEGGRFLRKLLMKFKILLHEVVGDTGSIVKTEFEKLERWVQEELDWELNRDAFVRKGMFQLEDGEEVELEMEDDEDDETGEYAPMVVETE